jgi:hypothetical protein
MGHAVDVDRLDAEYRARPGFGRDDVSHRDQAQYVRALLGQPGPEVTCEACFEHLDRYVELELAGRDAEGVIPGMRDHLEGCRACHEDRDSLAALLRSSNSAIARPREASAPMSSSAISTVQSSRYPPVPPSARTLSRVQ